MHILRISLAHAPATLLATLALAGCSGTTDTSVDASPDAMPDATPRPDTSPADVGSARDVVAEAATPDASVTGDANADAARSDASTVVDAARDAPVEAAQPDAASGFDASADVVAIDAAGADATGSSDAVTVPDAATADAASDAITVDVATCDLPNTVCSGTCVNTATDALHCGSCAMACPTNGTCANSTCACSAWQTLCTDTCADLAHDRLHCGDCATACAAGTACFGSTCGAIEVVSVDVNGATYGPAISDDTRYVAMHSRATNLVSGDTSTRYDIYVRDRVLGTWDRVSLAADGTTEGSGEETNADLSADGRVVVFQSSSTNLVATDVNSNNDVYAFDRTTRTLVHVSVGLSSSEFADNQRVSGNGRYVVFRTDGAIYRHGSTARQAILFDRTLGTYELISQSSSGDPSDASIGFPVPSGDGRYVAYESAATNIVPGGAMNISSVFVRDRMLGTNERVSVTTDGTPGNGSSRRPAISRNGRYVAFQSDATNLAGASGDTNAHSDVYVHDRTTHTTTRVSLRGDGTEPDGDSMPTGVSDTGRVVFYSSATNLIVGDGGTGRDVLTYDLATHTLFTVSSRLDGTVSGGQSDASTITPDGLYVAFQSNAGDLVTGATGAKVYLRYVGP